MTPAQTRMNLDAAFVDSIANADSLSGLRKCLAPSNTGTAHKCVCEDEAHTQICLWSSWYISPTATFG